MLYFVQCKTIKVRSASMNAYNFNQDQIEQMTKQATQQAEEISQFGQQG